MPRPTKCRRVCHYPRMVEFRPQGTPRNRQPILLTVDEYETIRLIDGEGLSQEQCSASMQIARTTVQKIYESARRKLADMLVSGRPLRIEGGEFRLCDGQGTGCGVSACFKQSYHQQYRKPEGDSIMRIAVTYENGQIFQHFGHTAQFKIYDVQDGKILSAQVVDPNGSGHGALAGVLTALNVDALICGGIGGGVQMALAAANIKLYGGVSGSADAAAQALAEGKLTFDPNAHCDHHDHAHGQGHTCGQHGCGGHCGEH
ncbi:DUF134 domain-containing protein [Subdoligranulum variabile]|uniref:DUF134 domain-containing protein n=1 Tax=Subdoligranulum variabile TaxID=214851 RepID=UPI0026EC7EEF|nr:DUF134 domain-containing protein [Subdoligranulum variabile]